MSTLFALGEQNFKIYIKFTLSKYWSWYDVFCSQIILSKNKMEKEEKKWSLFLINTTLLVMDIQTGLFFNFASFGVRFFICCIRLRFSTLLFVLKEIAFVSRKHIYQFVPSKACFSSPAYLKVWLNSHIKIQQTIIQFLMFSSYHYCV
jgi:hypothetical protein